MHTLVKCEFNLPGTIMTELIAYAHPQLSGGMKIHAEHHADTAERDLILSAESGGYIIS